MVLYFTFFIACRKIVSAVVCDLDKTFLFLCSVFPLFFAPAPQWYPSFIQTYSNTHSLPQIAHVYVFPPRSEQNLSDISSLLFPTEGSFREAPGSAAQLAAYRSLHVQGESPLSAAFILFFNTFRLCEFDLIRAHNKGQAGYINLIMGSQY